MQDLSLDALCFLLLSGLIVICSPIAQAYTFFTCDTSRNYTSGNSFQRNLNLTLSSLAANASGTGYYVSANGQTPNASYGLIQCRGYVSTQECRNCAYSVTNQIIQECPNQREASIYNELCSLQYSDWLFFSTADNNPKFYMRNMNNATSPVLFNNQLNNLLSDLLSKAASDASKLAAGSISYKDSINIYAMVQCTVSITGNGCSNCLRIIISYIPLYLDKREGGRMFALSCNFRYEIYLFYRVSPPPPPPTSSGPPPSPLLPQPNSTPATENNPSSHNVKSSNSKTIALIVTPVAAAAVVGPIFCCCFFWTKARRKRVDGINEDGDETIGSFSIGLKKLKAATRNFSDGNKLGQGGFGPVYKGKLQDGREIAVKRLSNNSKQGLEELKTEVILVAKLLHRNLVRLLGFCLEEEEKLLVYEFLPNGSLDKVLFDQNRHFTLEWERRYMIIVGIARGLLYLHEDSQTRIVHRDLKASNILLDEFMNPKISDFGLARLFSGSQTHFNTNRIAGTYGYMAPEYVKNGHFSTKSDVYSFGILVLEIISGRKNSSFQHEINLPSCAWKHWSNGTALEFLDPALQGDQWPRPEVLKCIHIGLLCVQESAVDRPSMSDIGMMLASSTVTAPLPSRPAFFFSMKSVGSGSVTQESAAYQSDKSTPDLLQQSINEVTVTDLDPR